MLQMTKPRRHPITRCSLGRRLPKKLSSLQTHPHLSALSHISPSPRLTSSSRLLKRKTKTPASPSATNAKDARAQGENVGKEGKEDGKATPEEEEEDRGPVGIANASYFDPGPSSDLSKRMSLIDKTAPPDILVHGLVTPEDVEKLFQMYVVFLHFSACA